MVAIGLILLVLAVAVALGIALDNTSDVDVSLFGQELSGLTQGTLFLLGVATGFVAALALGLILSGLKRRRAKKRAQQRQVHAARSDAETLAEENARLQDELARKQAASQADSYPTTTVGDSSAPASPPGRHAPGRTGE